MRVYNYSGEDVCIISIGQAKPIRYPSDARNPGESLPRERNGVYFIISKEEAKKFRGSSRGDLWTMADGPHTTPDGETFYRKLVAVR